MRIGVFDSGLGGLVIAQALRKALPEYDYVYYGDTARLPYGDKTSGQILSYTIEAMKFLIAQKCGLIIVACNTATAVALRYLQQRFIPEYAPDVKVLGVVIPTVEIAVDAGKRIGVVATEATTRAHIYEAELHKIKQDLEVVEVAAPELVPAIENNDFAKAEKAVEEYLKDFGDIDSLILGCTHYPLLKEFFRKKLPENVKVVSQDELMGAKLHDYLQRHIEIDITLSRGGNMEVLVSSLNQHYQEVARRLGVDCQITEVKVNA